MLELYDDLDKSVDDGIYLWCEKQKRSVPTWREMNRVGLSKHERKSNQINRYQLNKQVSIPCFPLV